MAPPGSKRGRNEKRSTRSSDSVSRTGKKRSSSISPKKRDVKKKTTSRNIHSNSSSDSDEQMDLIDPKFINDDNDIESEENTDSEPVILSNRKVTTTAASENFRQRVERRHIDDDIEGGGGTTHHSLQLQLELNQRVTNVERRLANLEKKFENQTTSFLTNGRSSRSKSFALSDNQLLHIGIAVRDKLFKSVKYFDNHCIKQEGKEIFKRIIQHAGMSGDEADEETLFLSIKRVIKKDLAKKRAHITKAIRDEAIGMRSLLFTMLFQCIRTLTWQNIFLDITKRDESTILSHKWYEHVGKFRCGNFDDATEDVKVAWITFVDNILGKFNKNWRNERVKSNHRLRDFITSSDEAFATLVSTKEMGKWVTHDMSAKGRKQKNLATYINKQDDNENNEGTFGGSGRMSSYQEFLKEIETYYDIYDNILEKRQSEEEGTTWEVGYTDAVTVTPANLPSSVSVATSSATKSYNSLLDGGAESEQDGHHGGKMRNIIFENVMEY